jgi:hypothetical protein
MDAAATAVKAYVTQHEINGSSQVVGVSLSPATAKVTFELYLELLESNWRESDAGTITKDNTFNRFSEPTAGYVYSAAIEREGEEHFVSVKEFDMD